EVWDTLAATPHEAKVAACGHGSESAIRDSAVATVADIVEFASVRQGDDVLEIGCGVGRIGLALAPRCRSWTGADISCNMLAEAATRLRGVSNVGLVKLQKTGLHEFQDGSFDVVYSTNAFDHLDQMDRWLYIKDAFRVLRAEGRLYVDNTNIQSEQGWAAFA